MHRDSNVFVVWLNSTLSDEYPSLLKCLTLFICSIDAYVNTYLSWFISTIITSNSAALFT